MRARPGEAVAAMERKNPPWQDGDCSVAFPLKGGFFHGHQE